MKKNLTNNTIKMLGLTIMILLTALKPAFCQEPAIDNDLIVYTMTASADQQVKFRLPKDIRSGDMITGTVVEERKNNSGEFNKTSSTLQGMVIEIDGKQTKLNNRFVSFIVPAGLATLPFVLKNSAGNIVERGQIPVSNSPAQLPLNQTTLSPRFSTDAVGQPGQNLRIIGSFDGNAANTNVSLNGQACETVAESPRMNLVQVSENATAGVSNLTIQENKVTEQHKINIATLELSADNTNLRKGQKVSINVVVNGFDGLAADKMNFKLRIENLSPQTISFLKQSGNVIVRDINPKSVKEGKYEFSTKIIALSSGVFTVSANLTAAADANECAKNYKDCVDAVEAKAKAETDKANESSNGTGASETIAKINKWAAEAKAKCLAEFLECQKNK